MRPNPSSVLVVGFLCYASAGAVKACKTTSPPPDAALVEAGIATGTDLCTLLEGLTQSGTVETICATAEEIAVLVVPLILTLRSGDAGAAPGVCTVVGTVCATKREIGQAIEYLVRARTARLLRDGGR